MIPNDAFDIWCDWYRDHFGREPCCTREQWDHWRKLEISDARTIDSLGNAEATRERRGDDFGA